MTGSRAVQGNYMRALLGCWELVRRENRDESGDLVIDPGLGPDPVGLLVYDAYFGRFTVDESRHLVTQTLEGALAPDNVGATVTRQMEVAGDTLTLRLPTTSANGDKIVRTLQWRRCRLPGAREV